MSLIEEELKEINTADDAEMIRAAIESVHDSFFADEARVDWTHFLATRTPEKLPRKRSNIVNKWSRWDVHSAHPIDICTGMHVKTIIIYNDEGELRTIGFVEPGVRILKVIKTSNKTYITYRDVNKAYAIDGLGHDDVVEYIFDRGRAPKRWIWKIMRDSTLFWWKLARRE